MIKHLGMWVVFLVMITVEDASALPRQSNSKRMMAEREIDQKTLELVEKQLLSLLGLRRKAVPRENLHIPDYMREVFKKWTGQTRDDTDPMTNVVRALHHVDSHIIHGKESMFFNVKGLPNKETIRKAELHIFREPKHGLMRQRRAILHQHMENRPSFAEHKYPIESRILNTSSSGWERFDVTSVVKNWIKNPLRKSKFTLEVIESENDPIPMNDILHLNKLSARMSSIDWERKRPILVIESNEGNKRRSRRDIHQSRSRRNSNRHSSTNRARKLHEKAKLEMCRRRNFYLDFQSIRWSNQIISPMGFDMYYCKGTCPKPLGPHMNTTNHAVIQNLVNSFDPTLVPPPCCVPSSLGDQSFLYIDVDSQIVMKTYSDIVVDGCGCR